MKLLILSDSHGDVGTLVDIVEKERPDEIIHLGDCWRDAETLTFAYPDTPMSMVPGNCDDCFGKKGKLVLERDGIKILLAHGHQWRVKSGPALALEAGREEGTDILLYGHTHEADCWQDGDMWVMNPGTAGGRYAPATYGVIKLNEGEVTCEIRPVEEEKPKLRVLF